MQALHDIFAIWGTKAPWTALASALDEKDDTVYRWFKRKRVPESAWTAVIEAARQKGKVLTVADMHAANRPTKVRGRSHKRMSPRRRNEARVDP
jgi:hypothetical protein